ncbi:hypothetical protein [Blastococcus sp. URHD0036]|uniref:hypothetical protein n=1 Tax=Blastococcus sp. URHD0036 TaxID=1380356 RepID=UPI0018CC553B|nr:hypothetical protein [Blastococcus sp. URHD0036]
MTASGALLLAPTAASADVGDPLSGCVAGLSRGDLAACLPPAPQSPALPAPGAVTEGSERTAPTPGVPLGLPLGTGSQQAAGQAPVQPQQSPQQPAEVAAADEPNPAVVLCEQLESGVALIPAPVGSGLGGLVGQLCELAEADPLAELQELLEGLLAQLPSLTDPAAGCQALIGLIEDGADTLGVDPAPLTGLIGQLCALVPGAPAPAPIPAPQPQPAAAHPVAQPQPQPLPAAAPVAHTTPAGSGQSPTPARSRSPTSPVGSSPSAWAPA